LSLGLFCFQEGVLMCTLIAATSGKLHPFFRATTFDFSEFFSHQPAMAPETNSGAIVVSAPAGVW
jgi:hypothetical protein